MIQEYFLGEPREVLPSDLRTYSGIFLRWLNYEERLAHSNIRLGILENIPKIFITASSAVEQSLRRIESVI